MIRIYTDGAWRRKNKAAGAGVAIIWNNGQISTYHRYLDDVTNNCAELEAIKLALVKVLLHVFSQENITLYSDSTYAIGMLTQDWKAKANQELILEIKELLKNFPNLEFKWVKGHSKDKYNRLADTLANIAIDQHFNADKYHLQV